MSPQAFKLAEAERRIERLEAVNRKLLKALTHYGRHLAGCALRLHGNPCDCGLEAMFKRLKEGK